MITGFSSGKNESLMALIIDSFSVSLALVGRKHSESGHVALASPLITTMLRTISQRIVLQTSRRYSPLVSLYGCSECCLDS